MRRVKVVLYGVGSVGSLIAKFLLKKEKFTIGGAIDIDEKKVGKDLGEVLGLRRDLGVEISNDVDSVLSREKADIAVHTTTSFLEDTYLQIVSMLRNNVDVISTCEELAYPYLTNPRLTEKLGSLAKKHQATILGTGINPGFLMDTLPLMLTTVCQEIERIHVVRVINAADRRSSFQEKIGAGLPVEEFKHKIKAGQKMGHVGLQQSIAIIAEGLRWKLDKITPERVSPVIAEETVENESTKVRTGEVAGLRQRSEGIYKNKRVILLDFRAYIGAEEEYDAIKIEGTPPVHQKIQPCVQGEKGTVAVMVNSIPKVIDAPPGLLTMKDLPVPSATLNDIGKYEKRRNS